MNFSPPDSGKKKARSLADIISVRDDAFFVNVITCEKNLSTLLYRPQCFKCSQLNDTKACIERY